MVWFVTAVIAFILSIFSTTVMSYVSMATPIGPWIAPTMVLCGMLVLKLFFVKDQVRPLSFIVVASSLGGIIATACGFSFPTLYFLDKTLFARWMASPVYFAAAMGGLVLSAGLFGIAVANILQPQLIDQEQLPFPIGQLTYKMIMASRQIKKAYELLAGFVATVVFCVLRDGTALFAGLFPARLILLPAMRFSVFSIPLIRFDMEPMYWAIGFVTGHVIAIPLAVGAIAKIILVDPLYTMSFAHYLSTEEFLLAFCSGMVLYGAIMSFTSLPSMISRGWVWLKNGGAALWWNSSSENSARYRWLELGLVFIIGAAFLRYFSFSIGSILFLYITSLACIYQIAVMAGKIGLATLGRFATFVMVPAMVFFQLDIVQTVFVAMFVEICGGVTADILFGRKMAQLAQVDQSTVKRYQYLGLLVCVAIIGIIFWVLINHFQLGSAQLFAYRAQNRALLIHVSHFNYWVLLLGALFSWLLKYMRVNPTLVLGGLLMPINISLGLIFGGLITLLVRDRQEWEPFWSGVFASNSLWVIFRAIMR